MTESGPMAISQQKVNYPMSDSENWGFTMRAKRQLPLISVIVPVYNVDRELTRCLASIRTQTYENLEIILVDDGSTDDSGSICDTFAHADKRAKVIHTSNNGLAAARNKGIDLAKGTLITFVDSDDYVGNHYVEHLYKGMERYAADISVCKLNVSFNGRVSSPSVKHEGNYCCLSSKEALLNVLYSKTISVSAPGKLYKKELFDSIRFPNGMHFEDVCTAIELVLAATNVAVSSYGDYNYVIRSGSLSRSDLSISTFDRVELALKAQAIVNDKYPDLKRATNRYVAWHELAVLRYKGNGDPLYDELLLAISKDIKKNRVKLLLDRHASFRDKAGILINYVGRGLYLHMSDYYERIRIKVNNGTSRIL